MMTEKIIIERRKAILLTVELNGTTEEYAMAWLILTNNAREYSNRIWKIHNTPGNIVFIYCDPESVEDVKNLCTGIVTSYREKNEIHFVGKVINEKEIIIGVPIYEWNSTHSVSREYEEWKKDYEKSIHIWIDVEDI